MSTSRTRSRSVEMEREAHFKDLPDPLVAKIISMIPFPAILKARVLSKTWKARLSSFSADNAEAKRCLVPSFHRDIVERSKTWGIMWIVFMSNLGELFAYDRELQTWRTMPCLSFIPHSPPGPESRSVAVHPSGLYSSNLARVQLQRTQSQVEGALVFICQFFGKSPDHTHLTEMYLANILTRSWKCFRGPIALSHRVFYQKLVVDESTNSYKVILVDYLEDSNRWPSVYMYIHDSSRGGWSCRSARLPSGIHQPIVAAYGNGTVYMLWDTVQDLLVYNLEEGTLNHCTLSHDYLTNLPLLVIDDLALVTNKEDLFMVLTTQFGQTLHKATSSVIRILKIDAKTGGVVTVANSEPVEFKEDTEVECTVAGDCMILGIESALEKRRVVIYNLERNDWSVIKLPAGCGELIGPSCFDPSMHTFMSV